MKQYRFAIAVAIVTSLLLVWLSLGVGIIGGDGDPSNRMYFGVIAVGLIGAFIARFKPKGMAKTLIAMAIVQAVITLIALIKKLGLPYSGPAEILILNAFFIALFVFSSWLFRRAIRTSVLTMIAALAISVCIQAADKTGITEKQVRSQVQGTLIANPIKHERGVEAYCVKNVDAEFLLILNEPVPAQIPTYLQEAWHVQSKDIEAVEGQNLLPVFMKRSFSNGWGLFSEDLSDFEDNRVLLEGNLIVTGVYDRESDNYECRSFIADTVKKSPL